MSAPAATADRSLTPLDYAALANSQLEVVAQTLGDSSRFMSTRHDQWRHLASGNLVEAGYVYAEPWAKILSPDGRQLLHHFRFTGRSHEALDSFLTLVA